MSFNSSRVDVHGHAINNVEGNQVNQTISAQFVHINNQGEIECTEYNEFKPVIRGDVNTLTTLYTGDLSEWEKQEDGNQVQTRSGQLKVCTVELRTDQQRKYTAAIYEGKDARIFWKKDFEHFSSSSLGNEQIWQLYGLNRSEIPFLIFHGELVPLAHVYKQSFWGDFFVKYLRQKLHCYSWEIWLNMEGKLCKGLQGPSFYIPLAYVSCYSIIIIPSAQFLQGDTFFRYFRQFPSPQLDKDILDHAWWQNELVYVDELFPKLANHQLPSHHTHSYSTKEYPYLEDLFRKWPDHLPLDVISGLRFDTVYSPSRGAVASWPRDSCSLWKTRYTLGLVDETEMGDGLIRFKLGVGSGDVDTNFPFKHEDFQEGWLAQSSRIIDAHGMSGTEEEQCFTVQPPYSLKLGTSPHPKHQKPTLSLTFENSRPIYLFIHPPMSISELISWSKEHPQTHFWSFDENGRSEMSEEECKRWGVPELVPSIDSIVPLYSKSWPTNVYTALRQWQAARGFDPTTADWARSFGYPEWEIISRKNNEARFEEFHKNTPWAFELHEHPVEQLDTSLLVQTHNLPKEVKNSFWGTLRRKGNQLLNSLTLPKIPGQPGPSRGQYIGGDDAHDSEDGQGVGSKRKAEQEDSNQLKKKMRLN